MLRLLFCWTGIAAMFSSLETYRYGCMRAATWATRNNGGTLGKPVPRRLRLALSVLLNLILTSVLAAVHPGYGF